VPDLASFVASILRDRVLDETKQEVDNLSEQLRKSRAVQVISASGTVIAEGHFEDGEYGTNPNLWLVKFMKQLSSCALSDLGGVELCIGGICKAHFGSNSIVEGFTDRDQVTYVDDWGCMNFCFGGTGQCWLDVKVGPFPSQEAFSAQVDEDIDAGLMVSFLTQELAVDHPELSVTFDDASFFVSAVKGAIRNLNLDPAIEVDAQRRLELQRLS
jgi:hypothetical protein